MNNVPERCQRLKRHHDLVVFSEIADEKEDLFGCHDFLLENNLCHRAFHTGRVADPSG
jgi:hypothetical protein